MKKYQNKSGNSGVEAFEIGDTFIKVQFKKKGIYTYNYTSPGKEMVEKMKELALNGSNLSAYIAQKVRDRYFNKE